MSNNVTWHDLLEKKKLQETLNSSFSGRNESSGVNIELSAYGSESSASISTNSSGFSSNTEIEIGCIAKSLTAMLITELISCGELNCDDLFIDQIGRPKNKLDLLDSKITIDNLLMHSHGLDGSCIEQVPTNSNGTIDSEALYKSVRELPRVSAPGSIYNYGRVGFWFIASRLEDFYQKQYSKILDERLFSRLGIEPDSYDRNKFYCPAIGEDLKLSAKHLLKILQQQISNDIFPDVDILLQRKIDLPGWSGKEISCSRGWKYFGNEWFGHNGRMRGKMTIVRFNVRENIALVISGTDQRSSDTAFAGVFGGIMPEFTRSLALMPPLLSPELASAANLDLFNGSYQNAKWWILIDSTSSNYLRMRAYDKSFPIDLNKPQHKRFLAPGENNMFYTVPSDPSQYPFLQFVKSKSENDLEYLWNGYSIWKKEH